MMIKNERQYKITKSATERFENALRLLEDRHQAVSQFEPKDILDQAEEDGLRSQLEDLKEQLGEYEALRSGNVTVFPSVSFGELPTTLIKARIARGLTQKQLASELGLKEQQVQNYEATDYASASFDRLRRVISVLGVDVREEATLTRRRPVQ